MPNYLCIQRSPRGEGCESPAKSKQPSPSEMQEMYAAYNAWREQFKDKIVDLGGRLGGGAVMAEKGDTDGPFMEAKEVVGGFMIISAASLEEAKEITRKCPGVVSPRSCVEVREIHTS